MLASSLGFSLHYANVEWGNGSCLCVNMLNACCDCVRSGVCGFLTFGSSVSQDVLMSYPPDDIAVAIARAFIVVCVITSYPILHFCGRYDAARICLFFDSDSNDKQSATLTPNLADADMQH